MGFPVNEGCILPTRISPTTLMFTLVTVLVEFINQRHTTRLNEGG